MAELERQISIAEFSVVEWQGVGKLGPKKPKTPLNEQEIEGCNPFGGVLCFVREFS